MEPFYTLQEFYTHTKGITYILILVFLIAVVCFWSFLAGKDEEKNGNNL